MNNSDYFELAMNHDEELIDPYYHEHVEKVIIPKTIEESNALTKANNNLIQYISTIDTMINDLQKDIDSSEIKAVIELMIKALNTHGMNYSSFCQYFNVHNVNYSLFQSSSHEDKIKLLKYIIRPYINDRHKMYLSHGYSNIVLQVMCDNYSHKRKGNYGANLIGIILEKMGINDLANMKNHDFNQPLFYLKSDKNGKSLFKQFANEHGIKLTAEGMLTEKYPDALIKIGDHYFIVEQKNMKENGGGQDKQTTEITEFVNKKPEFKNLHYITFINGVYFNQFKPGANAKTMQQYTDIVSVLAKHKENYFVNTFAFNELIHNSLNNYMTSEILKVVNDKL